MVKGIRVLGIEDRFLSDTLKPVKYVTPCPVRIKERIPLYKV